MSDRYPGRRYGGGASLYLGRGRRRGRGRQYFGPPIGHINRYQPRLPHSPKEQSDRHPQAEASLGHNNFQQVTSTERLQRLVEAKRNLELEIINSKIEQIEMERDSRSRR